jgi:hypothetical protein
LLFYYVQTSFLSTVHTVQTLIPRLITLKGGYSDGAHLLHLSNREVNPFTQMVLLLFVGYVARFFYRSPQP